MTPTEKHNYESFNPLLSLSYLQKFMREILYKIFQSSSEFKFLDEQQKHESN